MLAPLQFPFSPSSATPSPNSHPNPNPTAVDGYNPVIKQSSTRSLYSTMMAHASGNHNCGNFYIINAFIVNDIYICMQSDVCGTIRLRTHRIPTRHIHKWRLFIVYMPHKQKVRPTLSSRPNSHGFGHTSLTTFFSNCVVLRLTACLLCWVQIIVHYAR